MRELLGGLDGLAPAKPEFAPLVNELERCVIKHSDEDETNVLPAIRSALSEQEQLELGSLWKDMKAALPEDPNFEPVAGRIDEFVKRTSKGKTSQKANK